MLLGVGVNIGYLIISEIKKKDKLYDKNIHQRLRPFDALVSLCDVGKGNSPFKTIMVAKDNIVNVNKT